LGWIPVKEQPRSCRRKLKHSRELQWDVRERMQKRYCLQRAHLLLGSFDRPLSSAAQPQRHTLRAIIQGRVTFGCPHYNRGGQKKNRGSIASSGRRRAAQKKFLALMASLGRNGAPTNLRTATRAPGIDRLMLRSLSLQL
jgi:hypothetical protein